MRNQSCSIRSRGSAIEDRNRKTNSTGNRPCTASPLPSRNAAKIPMQPKANDDRHRRARAAPATPGQAGLERRRRRRGRRPGRRSAWTSAERHRPGELAGDQRGAAHRRQREPVEEAGLDVARQVGCRAPSTAKSPAWMNGTASAKVR